MMLSALFLAMPISSVSASCQSFGVDYQDGGSYFLDASHSLSFTALQYFTGCQNDLADNLLIDPSGNEKRCNRTPMRPDGVVQQINCDGLKMYTGDWSILILSYNGGAEPMMDQRDFHLSVGEQVDVDAMPTQLSSCHSQPAETATITSITISQLSVGMPCGFVPASTGLAISTPSSVITHAIDSAIPTAQSMIAIVLCGLSTETTNPHALIDSHTSRQSPTSLTIPAPAGLTDSRMVESLNQARERPGRFRKQMFLGWRPSNILRFAFAIQQPRMLDRTYTLRQQVNKPLATIRTVDTPLSQPLLSIRGPLKQL